jgi:hypothetical protein
MKKDISEVGPHLSDIELELVAGGGPGEQNNHTYNKNRTKVASKADQVGSRFEPDGSDTDHSDAPILE